MLIRNKLPPYYKASEINTDPRGLYVNIDTLELSYYMKSRMEKNPLWRDVSEVFGGNVSVFDIQTECSKLGDELSIAELNRLNDNITSVRNIKERRFPEQTIPIKATVRDAIDIFYKVNAFLLRMLNWRWLR